MAKAHEQSWEAGQNRLHEYMVDFDETLAALQDELGIGLLSPGPFRDASIKDPSEHFAVAGSAWAAMRATPYTPDAPQECLFPTARAAVECAAVPGIVPPAIRDRALMLDYYRRAMALDTLVGLQLLGHLAEEDAWLAYHALAPDLAMARPLDPRPLLYRGLGLHHVGRSDLADSVFRVAKTLMPADELERLLDISVLLPPPARAEYGARDSAGRRDLERIFFTINDPIYLTEVEERRIEHISRILWADLKFGAPNALGAENDRGLILLRYGHPATWSQRRAFDIVGVGAGGMMQGQRYHLSIPTPVLSLRNLVIAWEYPVELDVRETGRSKLAFEFQRPMASRIARLDSASLALARRLEAVRPQIYIPRTITSVSRYAHQMARFRGENPRLTSIEVYASPPLRVLGVGSGESVETGMFLFDAAWHLAWQDKRHTSVRDSVLAVSYRLEVQPGQYHYAVEARESGPDSVPRPLARTRLPVVAQEFPLDRVSVSDLLLADTIIQRVPVLARRDELVIVPSRRLEFDGHGSVHAYFEVYGLAPDEQGMGRYRAELAMVPLELPEPPEVSRRGRIAGAVRGLFRQPEEPDVLHATKQSWERASVVDLADDRVPEFLRIDLPALPPGDYGIEITVTDLHNGSAASSTRIFRVNEPPAPEPPG